MNDEARVTTPEDERLSIDLETLRTSALAELIGEICDAMEDGFLVPFLGAGVSQSAELGVDGERQRSPDEPEPKQPQDGLDEKLASALMKQLDGGLVKSFLRSPNEEVSVERLKELGLAKLCEIYLYFHSEKALCNELGIPEFCDLQPTPAHHYIAWLLREGAITEVITTNYDVCLERAWLYSKGRPYPNEYPIQLSDGASPNGLQVVTDAQEYAGVDGSRRASAWLYKINGCAQRYRSSLDRKHEKIADEAKRKKIADEAKRIILTERQLQSFRGESWALEMFRDRARHKKFVFSGFGSEEPQIRHTMLALVEEIEHYVPTAAPSTHAEPDRRWKLRTAPIVQQFGEWLSFNQHQILYAWWRAWERTEDRYPSEGLRNGITGADAEWFGGASKKLGANEFWGAIFQSWWHRQLRNVWQHTSLADQISDPAAVVRQLAMGAMDEFFGRASSTHVRLSSQELEANGNGEMPLMLRLSSYFRSSDRYHPLRDSPQPIAVFFIFLAVEMGDLRFVPQIINEAASEGAMPSEEVGQTVVSLCLPGEAGFSRLSRPGGLRRDRSENSPPRPAEAPRMSVQEIREVDAVQLLGETLSKNPPVDWPGWRLKIRESISAKVSIPRPADDWRATSLTLTGASHE